MTTNVKDRRPKVRGSARAYALLVKHLRLDKIGRAPFVHQADALAMMLERFERFDSFGLLHDMGCGKTLTVLGAALALHDQGEAMSMFVACPSSVVGAWERECIDLNERGVAVEFVGLTQTGSDRRVKVLQSALEDRRQRAAAGEDLPLLVVAMNYESTHRIEDALKAAGFDLDVCDESQRIKAAGSKQSLAMFRIGKIARLRVIMTGTPVPEGGLDWYGQMRFLDWTLFGKNYANFKARFAIEIDCGTFRKVVVNPHNKPELERLVMERCHRVSKAEAVDLPDQTSLEVEFDLSPAQRKVYDDLVKDSLAYIERGGDGEPGEIVGDNVLTRILRLQQITGGFVQVLDESDVRPADPKSNPKLKVLQDLLEDMVETGRKVVVFHKFTHEGLEIERVARKVIAEKMSKKRTGLEPPPLCVINGSIDVDDRGEIVNEFQTGRSPIFVAQIQAAGLGITLHAAADTIFYSMGYSSADYEQALARVHRIGQTQPVTHYHLLARRTIDESLYATLLRKREASEDAVDGGWRRYLNGGDV